MLSLFYTILKDFYFILINFHETSATYIVLYKNTNKNVGKKFSALEKIVAYILHNSRYCTLMKFYFIFNKCLFNFNKLFCLVIVKTNYFQETLDRITCKCLMPSTYLHYEMAGEKIKEIKLKLG